MTLLLQADPLVSVITIFLDCEDYLAEAIESVLAQEYPRWELVLVDDGSTDGSTDIAEAYARRYPEKIRSIAHPGRENRGMSASRNLGLADSNGVYVAFLDADDVWSPRKLKRQVSFLEGEPKIGMVYGPTEYWHSWTGRADDAERDHIPDLGLDGRSRFEPPALLALNYPLGTATAPCLCSLLIRTEAARRVGGFEESFTGFFEDQAFLAKMYASEEIAVIDECLDRYRIHDRSCSATTLRSGDYHRIRANYLTWLKQFIADWRIESSAVQEKLETALETCKIGSRAGGVQWLRLLRVAEGSAARLDLGDDQGPIRIAIDHTGTAIPYDIQLNLPRLKLHSGDRYMLTFLARADSDRKIGVGCAQGQAPWQNLGFYETIDLTDGWQHFARSFSAESGHDDARIHFDLGESAISVELSAVSLHCLKNGAPVVPDIPANRVEAAVMAPAIRVGAVDFGALRRVAPVSMDFGCDRGRPVDRYYIERFLASHSLDVRGHVLEIGESTYTRRFGGDRVTAGDVLHVTEGNPEATIIADLASADHIPSGVFDCIIITQTLQLIYDLSAAIQTIHRISKPGGVVLATVPGISQTYDNEWAGSWYWNFTSLSARRLFEQVFGEGNVDVEPHGNVLTALSFLHGIAEEELTPAELDFRGAGYDVSIGIRAIKRVVDHAGHAAEHRRLGRPSQRSVGGKGLALMYHRIAEGFSDPWSLCVSPQNFSEQLEVLAEDGHVMTVRDLAEGLEARDLPDGAVALTFDDGYADNLLAAMPLLVQYSCPATFFITSGQRRDPREFWWDELESLLLTPAFAPHELCVNVGGRNHSWKLGGTAEYTAQQHTGHLRWRSTDPPPTRRHEAFLELWNLIKPLSEVEQKVVMSELQKAMNRPPGSRSTHRRLSTAELVELSRNEHVEIGAHTVSHPILPSLGLAEQRRELLVSKAELERLAGVPVTSFAFPYGSHTDATVELVREAGFRAACTTEQGPIRYGVDLLRLPRFKVDSWGGTDFRRRFASWRH